MSEAWSPQRAANRISHILNAFSAAQGTPRFPVDVPSLALEAGKLFNWDDHITSVTAANINQFEGALYPDEGKKRWLLLYNEAMPSLGRVRFTQAHELGHYILHRQRKDKFECTGRDMLDWSDETNIEAQADLFASYLLMPIDDFRNQLNAVVDLDILGHCADRYGVSLTATILKWLQFTEDKAVLVLSHDGFMDWACSSKPALEAGAYFATRKSIIEIPESSVCADADTLHDRRGRIIAASTWFPYAEQALTVREMKITAEQYGTTLTLLHLPHYADVWPSRKEEV